MSNTMSTKPHMSVVIVGLVWFSHVSISVLAAEPRPAAAGPYRTMKYTSRPADDAKTWQTNVRAQLSKLLKMDDLLQSKSAIPLRPKELLSADRGTYHVKEIEISSTQARRIRIALTIPSSQAGPFPAVVCVGGHGSNQYTPYNTQTFPEAEPRPTYKGFGTTLAKRGYVTISTTVSQHEVHEQGRLLMAERLWDVMRCVDYLETLPQVDKSRIGCAGLSLGGEMTMWLGAMDERIAATVSAGFLTTMDHMEQNHCMCWKFDGLRELVDYADIYSLIAPRPLQCQNGMLEPPTEFYVPLARQAMEEIRTIYTDMHKPENAVLDVHDEGHVIDLPALVYFFEKHLYGNRWLESANSSSSEVMALSSHNADDDTALANASDPVSDKPYVLLERGDIRAVIINNEPVDDDVLPGHRAGYSGVASLVHRKRHENLFVPLYAGLNFEHIHDGTTQAREILFEPRNAPMEIKHVNEYTVELYQPPSPNFKLESWLRYDLLEDGVIEMTLECIPRARTFKNGYIGLFFASYIHQPESLDIHFLGHAVGEDPAHTRWIRGVTLKHGELSTHLAANDFRQFKHDSDFPLSLVFSCSDHHYREPWYYGVSHGMALVLMFRQQDEVRFSQSPSGGGKVNPAWDFQWFVPGYEVGRRYRFVMRAMYVPFESPEQIIQASDKHRAVLNPA